METQLENSWENIGTRKFLSIKNEMFDHEIGIKKRMGKWLGYGMNSDERCKQKKQ